MKQLVSQHGVKLKKDSFPHTKKKKKRKGEAKSSYSRIPKRKKKDEKLEAGNQKRSGKDMKSHIPQHTLRQVLNPSAI
jgi:hypothetical protein